MISPDGSRTDDVRPRLAPARRPRAGLPAAVAAAVSAVLLFGSVLVVASSPAGAANTAVEALVDHDSDAATPAVRRFAGSDRYATAVATAQRFVDVANALLSVDVAIVASGESLVDAAAAAALSSAKNAPILLTRRSRLPSVVARFLNDNFIREVFVLGGESAVSAAVAEDLQEVESVRTVTRLAGPNRYATAAAVSTEVGDAGQFCSTGQVAAVLANADASFADVMTIGPLAFALEVPILLTSAAALPAEAAGYLADAQIEHVVVVGGTAAIPAAVLEEVLDTGVVDITRISGANRYATAVAVSEAVAGCRDAAIELSPTTVALVNGYRPSDGVAAAPMLGQGLGSDGLTPMLLLTESGALPAATRDYLSATPIQTSDGYLNLAVTVVGGTAVVPAAAVDDAVEAATTAKALTATVKAVPGTSKVTVRFSESVDARSTGGPGGGPPAASVLNPANYRIAGAPLLAGDALSYDPATRTVTITLADAAIAAGDVVSVATNAISGVGGDDRRVAAVSLTVTRQVPDRLRPRLVIHAPENAYEFAVQVLEDNPDDAGLDVAQIKLNGEPLPAEAGVLDARPGAVNRIVCLYGYQQKRGGALVTAYEDGQRAVVPAPPQFAGHSWRSAPSGEGYFVGVNGRPFALRGPVPDPDIFPIYWEPVDDTTKCRTSPAAYELPDWYRRRDESTTSGYVEPIARGSVELLDDDGESFNPKHYEASTTLERHARRVTIPAIADPPLPAVGDVVTVDGGAFSDVSGNDNRTTQSRVVASAERPKVTLATLSDPTTLNRGTAAKPDFAVAGWSYNSTSTTSLAAFEEVAGRGARSEVLSRTYPGDTTPTVVNLYLTGARYRDRFKVTSAARAADVSTDPVVGLDTDGIPDQCGLGSEAFSDGVNAVATQRVELARVSTVRLRVCINDKATAVDVVRAIGSSQPAAGTAEGAGADFVVAYDAADQPDPPISFTITGKPDGIAGGARGNDWQVDFTDLGAAADDDDTADVGITVFERRRIILISFDDGATPATVSRALADDGTFGSNFELSSVLTPGQSNDPALLSLVARNEGSFSGGYDQRLLTLRYDTILRYFHAGWFAIVNADLPNIDVVGDDPVLIPDSDGMDWQSVVAGSDLPASLWARTTRVDDGDDYTLVYRSTDIVTRIVYDDPDASPEAGQSVRVPRGFAIGYAAEAGESCGYAEHYLTLPAVGSSEPIPDPYDLSAWQRQGVEPLFIVRRLASAVATTFAGADELPAGCSETQDGIVLKRR
ncbi:MAG TPA: hypothetical protein DEP66_02820 [Acidimicrobiaceae bacterium]|nr:hypothetical protein [Acidimicrobiaceae bacterium]